MKRYKDAAELATAFAAVVNEMKKRFSDTDTLPIADDEDFRDYQNFIARVILVQRDLDDLLEQAISLEDGSEESPLQILDFSSEWESFD
jgi:hypothetical protein